MTRLILVLSLLILPATGGTDPLSGNREMIKRGVQAVLTCNGLFTSHRSLEQVFAQELAYMAPHIGTAQGGDYRVHEALGAVEIGSADNPPVMHAAFREGIGCVVMAPGQTLDDIDSLPSIDRPAPSVDPTLLPWPQGEKIDPRPLPATIDPQALQAASDWAFDRDTPEQVTLSLLVVHGGHIVHERYAPGVNRQTRTRTWSALFSRCTRSCLMRRSSSRLMGLMSLGSLVIRAWTRCDMARRSVRRWDRGVSSTKADNDLHQFSVFRRLTVQGT